MSMRMIPGLDQSAELRTWVSPSLIEANTILSLSQQELDEVIRKEMEANPALELVERTVCPLCGGVIAGSFCLTCLVNQQLERQEPSYEDHPELLTQQSPHGIAEDDFDPMTLIATERSLPDQLCSDVRTMLDDDALPIASWFNRKPGRAGLPELLGRGGGRRPGRRR